MSTTVTYKGNTIATVNNATKTLTTQGKYLEDNITLTDVSGGGGGGTYQAKSVTYTPSGTQQIATISPDPGYDALSSVGITVDAIAPPYYDMSGANAWLGADATLVYTATPITVALANTDFNTWTPSTTAAVVYPAQTMGSYTATDTTTYNYVQVWDMSMPIVYTGSPVDKARPLLSAGCLTQTIFRRPGAWATIESKTFNTNVGTQTNLLSFIRYWNNPSSGSPSLTYTWSASYGFYYTQTAPTLSSTSSASPTITLKSPTMTARCSTTYMSTANAALIDKANTKLTIACKVYRVKQDSYYQGCYRHLVDTIDAAAE